MGRSAHFLNPSISVKGIDMERRTESLCERIGTLIMAGACIGGSADCYRIVLYDLNPLTLLIYLGMGFFGAGVVLIGIAPPKLSMKGHAMIRSIVFGFLCVGSYIGMNAHLADDPSVGFGEWMFWMFVTVIFGGLCFAGLLDLFFGQGRNSLE